MSAGSTDRAVLTSLSAVLQRVAVAYGRGVVKAKGDGAAPPPPPAPAPPLPDTAVEW